MHDRQCSFLQFETPIENKESAEDTKLKQQGCKCTRSMCLKNYCPCHRNGNKCNNSCSC